jgi:hypothetical protein
VEPCPILECPTSDMLAFATPQAPRAMVRQAESESTASSLERIFHNAAKRLYPRLALFEALAKFKDGHKGRAQSSDDMCEARRDFLDSFAYLCDVEKGGATVTAAGLQKLPLSNILWLAANEGISRDVEKYAENMLRKLRKVDSETQKAVEDDIFLLAVEKCSSRILFYKDEMQKYARKCRMQLGQEMRDGTGTARASCDRDNC